MGRIAAAAIQSIGKDAAAAAVCTAMFLLMAAQITRREGSQRSFHSVLVTWGRKRGRALLASEVDFDGSLEFYDELRNRGSAANNIRNRNKESRNDRNYTSQER